MHSNAMEVGDVYYAKKKTIWSFKRECDRQRHVYVLGGRCQNFGNQFQCFVGGRDARDCG